MKQPQLNQLSRRERQIIEILVKAREATAADVHDKLPDQPSYSTVRALLAVLEKKGYVRHRREGRAYVYSARMDREKAGEVALKNVVHTFFDGSIGEVVATLINMKSARLTDEEFDRLSALVEDAAKKKGKKEK